MVTNVATINPLAQPEVTSLFHEHRQLGVRPIPLKLILPHVLHKDNTILLLRLLGLLLWGSLLALRVVLLVALPGNGSAPSRLNWELITAISQVLIEGDFRRVLLYDLDFLDHLGLDLD